jgi:hypothetical protein
MYRLSGSLGAFFGAFALLVRFTQLGGEAVPPPSSPLDIKEELLGEKSADSPVADKDEDTVSPDGRQVAWRDKRGKQWVVMLNGQPQGAAYDDVHSILFSPDSRHLAYAARRGNDRARIWRVVLDGQEQKEAFGGVVGLKFSVNSQRFAYMGREKNSVFAVVDGKRGPEYKGVLVPIEFTEDGQHYAYTVEKGDQWLIVSDGVEGPAYDGAGPPRFTPKGNLLRYSAKRRGAWVVVENGKEITPEAKGGYVIVGVTPQQEKVIAVSYGGKRTNRDLRVVIGGQAGPLVDSVTIPIFSATDDHYVYAAHRVSVPALKANRAFGQIVIDGKEGRQYEALTESTLSAWMNAGERILFPAAGVRPWFNPRWHGVSTPAMTRDGMHVAYAARKGDKEYVVVIDDVEGPSFEGVPCGPTYGSDGKLYYTAFEAGKLITIVDEKRVSELAWKSDKWGDNDGCSALLAWEGGHWGYMTEQGGNQYFSGQTTRAKRTMVVDGQAGPEYDAVAVSAVHTQLSGGAFHFSYEVHENKASNDASFVVLDGQEGRQYDAIFIGSSEFLGDKTVTFVARSGRRFVRVMQSRQ